MKRETGPLNRNLHVMVLVSRWRLASLKKRRPLYLLNGRHDANTCSRFTAERKFGRPLFDHVPRCRPSPVLYTLIVLSVIYCTLCIPYLFPHSSVCLSSPIHFLPSYEPERGEYAEGLATVSDRVGSVRFTLGTSSRLQRVYCTRLYEVQQ